MNKKILVAGLAVVALGAAHTAFWVYQSGKIKESLVAMSGQVSKEIAGKNTEFLFASSEVSGYPLNFVATISQPKFTRTGGGEKLELSGGEENLVITSNLLGNSYNVKLPTKIDVKDTIGEKEKNYKLEFANASPEFGLKFSGNFLFSMKPEVDVISYLAENLTSLSYSDSGYVLSNAEGGAKLASSDSSFVQIAKTNGKSNGISTSYNIKVKNIDNSGFLAENEKEGSVPAQAGLWPISANIDLTSVDVQDENGKSISADFIIKDVDVTAATFGFGIKGDVKANGDDVFPFGDLSIKVRSYQNMVDYFSVMVSNALAESKIPLFNIKSEKSIDFKKVLYDVASEKSNEDKDILLTLNREKGKSLFIGQKGLMEVIDLLKASASAPAEQPKKDAAAPKISDAAPAAGAPVDLQMGK